MKKNPLPKMLFKWIASIKVLFLSLAFKSLQQKKFLSPMACSPKIHTVFNFCLHKVPSWREIQQKQKTHSRQGKNNYWKQDNFRQKTLPNQIYNHRIHVWYVCLQLRFCWCKVNLISIGVHHSCNPWLCGTPPSIFGASISGVPCPPAASRLGHLACVWQPGITKHFRYLDWRYETPI